MVDIRHQGACEAPLSVAFDYVDDYRNTTSWLFGLTKFEPVDGKNHGLGAVFDGTFSVKPVKLNSRVEVTEWAKDEVIAYRSVKGFKNWSTWRFRADGDSRTILDVVFSYELPGGLAGKALGKALEPIVALSVQRTDHALRRNIERAHQQT